MLSAKMKRLVSVILLTFLISMLSIDIFAVSQVNRCNAPGGRLESHVWRDNGRLAGNTYQWTYQVAAKYFGNNRVNSIKTSWTVSCCMRSRGQLSIGVSFDGVSVEGSSSWTTLSEKACWENNNGSTESSFRSNIVVSPSRDYRSNTISVINEARATISGDAKSYVISAGV